MAGTKKNSPKNPQVTLRVKGESKRERVFSISHALQLLRLPKTGWEISDDKYIFENNDIKRRPSSKGNTESGE